MPEGIVAPGPGAKYSAWGTATNTELALWGNQAFQGIFQIFSHGLLVHPREGNLSFHVSRTVCSLSDLVQRAGGAHVVRPPPRDFGLLHQKRQVLPVYQLKI